MKAKQVLTILLLVFVVGSLAYMVVKESESESSTDITANSQQPATVEKDTQLIVYYFHGNVRCATCHKLESYVKEALETNFSEAIALGSIIWKSVNVDKPENKHFIQDYALVTKSVILSRVVDGKEAEWKNLDQIWQKVADKNDYLQYVSDSVAKFLEEAKS